MRKKFAWVAAALTVSTAFVACNSTGSNEPVTLESSAMVTSFKLGQNLTILPGMDSVYFTIDQRGRQIFNADSLPKGTRINKLVPVVVTNGASIVEMHVPRAGKPDSIYNLLENKEDSIDFSSGNVKLRIVSLDKQTTTIYNVKVNVHRVATDTLIWQRLEQGSLPSRFSVPTQQHTTCSGDNYYCLTRLQNEYCLARTNDPAGAWQYTDPQFGFTPNINSLTATDDALYMLDTDGGLHRSADQGATWTATGQQWNWILGAYGTRLLGTARQSGKWMHVSYPDGVAQATDPAFPVTGASQTVSYTYPMATSPLLMLVGGRNADGALSNAAWGYDGNTWARTSITPLPYALENMALVPFFVSKVNKASWVATRESVMMAMGGTDAQGRLNDTIYITHDMGMNWERADSLMQSTKAFPARTRMQAFCHTSVIKGAKAAAWRPVLRITQPVTQWDCPYVYLFGGENAQGQTYNTVYRGTITRFALKPVE